MNTRSALGAAAGLTLALAGGASALGLGLNQATSSSPGPAAIVTEYVDQFGNPVAAPATASADGMPQIVLMQPDGSEYEDDEYEEAVDHDHDHEEYEDD